jgi:hypothetical protein
MISVTVLGTTGWLVPFSPNTDDPVQLSLSVPSETKRGLTGRTSRRSTALLLRYQMSWVVAHYPTDFNAARVAWLAAQDEPIFVPMWPAARLVGTSDIMGSEGGRIYWNANFTSFAINAGSSAGWTYFAPLLQGRLTQAPRMTGRTPTNVLAEWTFKEDSPASMSIQPPATGEPAGFFNTPAGNAAAVFPWVPEGTTPPAPVFARVDVDRKATGPGRQQTTIFYPQVPEQGLQATMKFTTAAAAIALMGWWQRRGGQADAFWLATSQKLGDLSTAATAGQNNIDFTANMPTSSVTALLGSSESVALFGPDAPLELANIIAIYGNVLVTAANLGYTHAAAWTTVAPAMLVTHADPELALEFKRAGSDWQATTTLSFREVAAEYQPTSDETIGTTIGRLPGVAWFFQIDLDYNGAIASTYLTNWESGIVADGQVWTYNDCSFDKLVASIDLEDDSCTFSAEWFTNCPWSNWLPGNLAARGFLTIFRADVSPAGVISNFAQVWKGEMSTPTLDGQLVKQTVLGANAVFGRKAPRQCMSTSCGTNLFKPRCGLVQASWTAQAGISAIAGNLVTIYGLVMPVGGVPAALSAVNGFGLGYLQWTVGTTIMRAGILASTAMDGGGNIQLTLDRPAALTVGQILHAVPGCDRTGTRCRAFGNYANFRGFEFMPAVDPCFIIPQSNTNAAKK